MVGPELDGPCTCHARDEAVRCGELLYIHPVGWVMTDVPLRHRSRSALSQAAIHNIDDHTGEHYTLDVCPWCGYDLPLVSPDNEELE